MPCTKCSADFTLLTWKLRCYECEEYYCSKCLKKVEGDLYCDVCEILIKRPPIRAKLMELKSKDLQLYLNKHNISTHGIVEKQELVELFCKNQIPVRHKKCQRKFNAAFSGSVPNLATRSQTYFNTIRSNAEAALSSRHWIGGQSANNSPNRSPQSTPPEHPPQPSVFTSVHRSPENQHESPTTSTNHTNVEVCGVESSPIIPRKYPKLSDFDTANDLNDLSVKQLKELLTLNRVNYKGCVEKAELLERANRLWNDSHTRKEENETHENFDEFCKICMDAPLDCVLLECGHMATCIDCGKRLAECPICRQYVTRVVRTFKA